MQALQKSAIRFYSSRSVQEFYDKTDVFVTGASGFVGKALVEKLLRSCGGVNNIYILLRPKRKQTIEERFESYLKNPAFDRIRNQDVKLLEKVKYISGDLTQPNLGVDLESSQLLKEKINVVLNVAASVRFSEPLNDAINLNTLGVQRILELSKGMHQLKSLVHVSTAYSNPYLKDVPEEVCKIDLPDNWNHQIAELPNEELNSVLEAELKKYPNTYTLTKNLAEQIVKEYSKSLPISIVRPSIISSSSAEPFEGWIDGINTTTVYALGIKFGIFGSLRIDEKCVLDVIPVDRVVNSIIVAGSLNQQNNFKVYNCTSGSLNPLTVGGYLDGIKKNVTYEGMLRNPPFGNSSYIGHKLHRFFFNHLPYSILDFGRWMVGKEPTYMKKCSKFLKGADALEYFARKDWNFEADNFKHLIEHSKNQEGNFSCDIRQLDWDEYMENSIRGMDKFILKKAPKTTTDHEI